MTTDNAVSANALGMLDLTAVPVEDNELLPSGVYPAQVVGCEVKTSGAGHLYYNFTFHLTDEEHLDRPLWGIVSFAPKAINISIRTLESILGTAIPRTTYDVYEHADDFAGKFVSLKVGMREWEGTQRNNVERITGMGQAAAVGKPAGTRKRGLI